MHHVKVLFGLLLVLPSLALLTPGCPKAPPPQSAADAEAGARAPEAGPDLQPDPEDAATPPWDAGADAPRSVAWLACQNLERLGCTEVVGRVETCASVLEANQKHPSVKLDLACWAGAKTVLAARACGHLVCKGQK